MARERPWAHLACLRAHAREWRRRNYDVAINFEPDIRSNFLLAMSGAPGESDSSRAAAAQC